MRKIFLSHSKADGEMRDYFLKICGLEGVRGISVEFEYFPAPPWEFIKKEMFGSDAFFLLLGRNVIDIGVYTQNWISFEVGLACQLQKEIWIFEQLGSPVHFPVPYLNHYVLYDPKVRKHLDYIRAIIATYKQKPRQRKFPPAYAKVKCPRKECLISFFIHTTIDEFECPSCRKLMKIV